LFVVVIELIELVLDFLALFLERLDLVLQVLNAILQVLDLSIDRGDLRFRVGTGAGLWFGVRHNQFSIEKGAAALARDGAELSYVTTTRGRSVLTQHVMPSVELTGRHERPAKTSVSITSRSRFCGMLDRDLPAPK
jgi:hypothetical protein